MSGQQPGLKLYLLGPPRIEYNGEPLSLSTRKATALLAYLVITGRSHSREELAALLYPEYDAARAAANLRQTLWAISRAGLAAYLDANAASIGLQAAPHPWADVDVFRAALATCKSHKHAAVDTCAACLPALREAADLYRADFLSGFTLKDSPAFDEWQMFEAEGRRQEAASLFERLSHGLAAQGDHDAAIAAARRWLNLDPLHEPAHRCLMLLYATSGHRSLALRQYEECTRILRAELAAKPGQETAALYEQIKHGGPQAVEARLAARNVAASAAVQPGPEGGWPGVLPRPVTPFVGRQAELARIAELLADPACRLLTLAGPGGIGKTRLAIQAGQAAEPHLPVCYVSLAAVARVDFLAAALTEALGCGATGVGRGERAPESRQQLLDFLRSRQALLVLDNFEHLTAGAVLLTEIIAAAPGVKILVTSREHLRVTGEWVLEVDGMPCPSDEGDAAGESGAVPPGAASLPFTGAVELFVQYARQARPDFSLDRAEYAAAIRICRLLAGSPLGIQLAAGWVRLLSCREIAGEMARDLDFLDSAARDIPERQRSLRAAFEHSWRLLPDDERRAFARLSVFQGGFTRAAAREVADASLPVLSALADRSLIRVTAAGRYDMHEVLKQYAVEKLTEQPELLAGQIVKHCVYYLGLLAGAEPQIEGAGQQTAISLLTTEAANIRQAVRNGVETGVWELLAAATPSIILYYLITGRNAEGDELLAPLIRRLDEIVALDAHGQAPEPPLRAEVHALFTSCAAYLATRLTRPRNGVNLARRAVELALRLPPSRSRGHALLLVGFGRGLLSPGACVEQYRQCLAAFEAAHDRWGRAMALLVWADGTYQVESDEQRAVWYQRSVEEFEVLGDRWSMALGYNGLSYLTFGRGDYASIERTAAASLGIYRLLGERWRAADVRFHLAAARMARGAYTEAADCYRENASFLASIGRLTGAAAALNGLGGALFWQGDITAAAEHYNRALTIYRSVNDPGGIAVALAGLGQVALAQGDAAQALTCYIEAGETLPVEATGPGGGPHAAVGALALELGRYDDAGRLLSLALSSASRDPWVSEQAGALAAWGRLLAACGETAQAAEALSRLVADPATPVAAREQAQAALARLPGRAST
jgi:predicted ATPase/DNA-binding SARP family transcriptional activator